MSNSEITDSVPPSNQKPFYCKDCHCGFDRILHYNNHLESKKHKKRISKETKLHLCSICQKNFSYLSNLCRHRTKCIENQAKEENKKNAVPPKVDLQKENEELRKENELLKKEKNATINNITKVGKQTNIKTQNNIIINCFGNENLTHLTDKVLSLIHI